MTANSLIICDYLCIEYDYRAIIILYTYLMLYFGRLSGLLSVQPENCFYFCGYE